MGEGIGVRPHPGAACGGASAEEGAAVGPVLANIRASLSSVLSRRKSLPSVATSVALPRAASVKEAATAQSGTTGQSAATGSAGQFLDFVSQIVASLGNPTGAQLLTPANTGLTGDAPVKSADTSSDVVDEIPAGDKKKTTPQQDLASVLAAMLQGQAVQLPTQPQTQDQPAATVPTGVPTVADALAASAKTGEKLAPGALLPPDALALMSQTATGQTTAGQSAIDQLMAMAGITQSTAAATDSTTSTDIMPTLAPGAVSAEAQAAAVLAKMKAAATTDTTPAAPVPNVPQALADATQGDPSAVVAIDGRKIDPKATAAVFGPAGTLLAATTAGQTQPQGDVPTTPEQANAAVAQAALQRASGHAPMSRMQEIRSRLQAAQVGANASGKLGTANGTVKSPTLVAGETKPVDPAVAVASTVLEAKTAASMLAQKEGAVTAALQALAKPDADAAATQAQDPSVGLDPSLTPVLPGSQKPLDIATSTATAAVPISAVASTLVSHARAGNSEFTIRLDPADLGKIDVKMSVGSDGQVRAHMIVERPDTLDMLMRDQRNLQQSLDQAGFKSDASSLQFSLKDNGQNQQQQQQAWRGAYATLGATTTPLADPNAIASDPTAHLRSVSARRPDGVDLSV